MFLFFLGWYCGFTGRRRSYCERRCWGFIIYLCVLCFFYRRSSIDVVLGGVFFVRVVRERIYRVRVL